MIKKNIFVGFLTGLTCNGIGLLLAIFFLGNGNSISTVIQQSLEEGFFTKLVSVGAVLNLVAFFIFIKRNQDYRARGVLLATIVVAVLTFLIKFF